MKSHDVVILGTSPNALSAAIVLARGGLSVLVLDTASAPGGPVATEAFHPGFLADTGVASAALDPQIAEDLAVAIPALRRLTFTSVGARVESHREVPLPPAFHDGVRLLRAAYSAPAPSVPVPSEADVSVLDALLSDLRGLGARPMREVIRLLFLSMRDFVRESDLSAIEGLLGTIAMRSRQAGPFDEGTLFGLLHHTAIHDDLTPSTVRGGLGKLPKRLMDTARAANADVRLGVPGPLRIDVADGNLLSISDALDADKLNEYLAPLDNDEGISGIGAGRELRRHGLRG